MQKIRSEDCGYDKLSDQVFAKCAFSVALQLDTVFRY